MRGFVKMFSSLLTSSVWCEDDQTVRVWITLLLAADSEGIVEGSVPGIANLARVPVDRCRAALERFMSPDPDSRSTEREGRRIEPVPGGWRVFNYSAYRERSQDKEGSKAPYMRALRARRREEKPTPEPIKEQPVTTGNALPEQVTSDGSAGFFDEKVTRYPDKRIQSTENGTATTAGARAREPFDQDEGEPPPQNPLVDAEKLIAEGYALIKRIGELVPDEDPTETLARASTGNGKLRGGRKVSLEAIAKSPDHLAQTVCDLRERVAGIEAELSPPEVSPPEPEPDSQADELVKRITKRLRASVNAHSWATWFRPLVGIELTRSALRVAVPSTVFLGHLATHRQAIDEAMQAEGVAGLRLELVTPGRADPSRRAAAAVGAL